MNNDPAFLFYSKDWLQGTAQMSAEERGIYVNLLCHQHQDNGLPVSTKRLARMVNLTEEEFLKVWDFLKVKFHEEDGKLFNKKLVKIVNGRTEHGEMRRVIGTFGRLIKDLEISEKLKKEIRNLFNYKDFISKEQQTQQNLSKAISNWLASILPKAEPKTGANIGSGTEDGNETEDEDDIGGVGGKEETSKPKKPKDKKFLLVKMNDVWLKHKPDYAEDVQKDFTALRSISEFILNQEKVKRDKRPDEEKVIGAFEFMTEYVSHHDFFKNYSLKQLDNNIQSVITSIQNGKSNGEHKQATGANVNTASAFDKITKLHSKAGNT